VKIDWDRTEGWKQTYYLEWDEGKTATAQISFNDRDVPNECTTDFKAYKEKHARWG
jgi:hypothetical protein